METKLGNIVSIKEELYEDESPATSARKSDQDHIRKNSWVQHQEIL